MTDMSILTYENQIPEPKNKTCVIGALSLGSSIVSFSIFMEKSLIYL